MSKNHSDTTIPLEWDAVKNCWPFPLLDHNWAELSELMTRENGEYRKLSTDLYHVQRDASGLHQVQWTGEKSTKPSQIYGSVAVKPKPSQHFLGMPVPIANTIISALAGMIAGIIALYPWSSSGQEGIDIDELNNKIVTLENQNQELLAQQTSHNYESQFIRSQPDNNRKLYLLGESHGLREQAIRQYFSFNSSVMNLALQSEREYLANLLGNDRESRSFEEGKVKGRKKVDSLMELTEVTGSSGSDLYDK